MEEIPQTILLELQRVRDDGRTNMFDVNGVRRVAYALDCYELAGWIEDLSELPRQARSTQFMAALNAMGKLPRAA